jgi:transcriptional regulator with GAF, ATPase, and Fis domain
MLALPSRDRLAAITRLVEATARPVMLGLAWNDRPGAVRVLHSWPHGVGAHLLPAAAVAAVLSPSAAASLDAATVETTEEQPIEWMWHMAGVRRVFATVVPGLVTPTRLWIGLGDAAPVSPSLRQGLEDAARAAAALLDASPSVPDAEPLRRLEAASALLPSLIGVLDPREVFRRLSTAGAAALPHDLLILGLFDESLTTMTLHTISAQSAVIDQVPAERYPVAASHAFDFDILDDRAAHPIERDRMPTGLGMRSSLRLPLRVDDRVIGGVGFNLATPRAYSIADVAVGRRLADIVAVALSHQQLAERLAEEARRHEELRAQAANLELLDRSLVALTDRGAVSEAFARFSAIAQSVLPHDAASVLVRLPDGTRARRYASVGLTATAPEVVDIPRELLDRPEWVHDVVDDMRERRGPPYEGLVQQGFLSLLRVSLRHDERFAGALVFAARRPAAFAASSVTLAQRIADRIAVTLARDRELEEAKRANEASERALKLEARVRALTEELDARTGYRRVVGESAPWREVLLQATRVAATDTTVLLLGESGTGKEVVARFVHRASPRSQGPFVALNCAALPEQLLEAELFGYERGAFTGAMQSKPGQLELAAGGTLLLDEVGEMSPSAQAKFLRVLQEREFKRLGGTRSLTTDARVVAATNRDLRKAVAQGQFREDLYYRLDVFAIRLPALRERRDDILALCDAFLTEIGRGLGRPPAGVSREARQALLDYAWPGNVRELRNIIERAAILCDGGLITTEHLSSIVGPGAARPSVSVVLGPPPVEIEVPATAPPPAPGDIQSVERAMIEQALASSRFNKSKAAVALGLTRHQLYLRMKKYGLE